ncbi:hypothetical protein VTG60DRAFT_94 [Thermothelomyces hinnuleus]
MHAGQRVCRRSNGNKEKGLSGIVYSVLVGMYSTNKATVELPRKWLWGAQESHPAGSRDGDGGVWRPVSAPSGEIPNGQGLDERNPTLGSNPNFVSHTNGVQPSHSLLCKCERPFSIICRKVIASVDIGPSCYPQSCLLYKLSTETLMNSHLLNSLDDARLKWFDPHLS